MIRVHRILPQTRAEGPGLRYTIWVQGCSNRCPSCWATKLWDPAGGEAVSVADIIADLDRTEGLEGITLLGGEPFEQAAGLSRIAAAARARGLSVLTFTGLTYEAILAEGDPDRLSLLSHTDLLIDGPYLEARRDFSRPWVGSSNQRYLFLTPRYSMDDVERCGNRIEIRVDRSGVLRLNGMGEFNKL